MGSFGNVMGTPIIMQPQVAMFDPKPLSKATRSTLIGGAATLE